MTDDRSRERYGSVALAVSRDEMHVLLGKTLLDGMASLTSNVSFVGDGDKAALNADLLMLAGGGRSFPKFAELLRGKRRRPRTLLWQTDSLPPSFTTVSADEAAVCAARDIRHEATSRRGSFRAVAEPIRTEVRRMFSRWMTRRFRRAMRSVDRGACQNIHWNDLRFIYRQADWIIKNASASGGWIDHVFVSVPTRASYLERHGIMAGFAPVGYHPLWGEPRSVAKDIDVLFLGRVKTGTRKRMVPRIMSQLAAKGFKTRIAEAACFGEERTELLNRTRVVLNIMKFPWEFAGMRLLMSIGCRALVISDTCADTRPYHAGKHFVSSEIAGMADAAAYYLEHQEERRGFAESAYSDLRSGLTVGKTVEKMLDVVFGLSSAAA